MNQQLLVEEFLKEKMRENTEKRMQKNPSEDPQHIINKLLLYYGKEQDAHSPDFYDDRGRLALSTLLFWRCGFNGNFEKIYFCGRFQEDTGKEFFEWSKAKCRELSIPLSTFKTIKETRQVAKRLTEEWYDKFEGIEKVIEWFQEEEFCFK